MDTKRKSLAELQAESLLATIKAHDGHLALNKSAYRFLKRQGFNRTDIDNAMNLLALSGDITTDATEHGIVLREVTKQQS